MATRAFLALRLDLATVYSLGGSAGIEFAGVPAALSSLAHPGASQGTGPVWLAGPSGEWAAIGFPSLCKSYSGGKEIHCWVFIFVASWMGLTRRVQVRIAKEATKLGYSLFSPTATLSYAWARHRTFTAALNLNWRTISLLCMERSLGAASSAGSP